MKKLVIIGNKTGLPDDTEIFIDGKKLPLSHLMSVDISIRPDSIMVAKIELVIDELDTLATVDINTDNIKLPKPKANTTP